MGLTETETHPTGSISSEAQGFDQIAEEDELQSRLGVVEVGCAINNCDYTEMDERGPIFINADGKVHEVKMCVQHWEAIVGILGDQTFPSTSPEGPEDDESVNFLRGYKAIEHELVSDEVRDSEADADEDWDYTDSPKSLDDLIQGLKEAGIEVLNG